MKSKNEYIGIIKEHAEELNSKFGITSLCLFGSVARDEHHDGSDIDLFVTMPSKLFNFIAASQYLENLLGCGVDLIQDNRNIRPFFRKQIENDGIYIFKTTGNC